MNSLNTQMQSSRIGTKEAKHSTTSSITVEREPAAREKWKDHEKENSEDNLLFSNRVAS